jgi:hypothetical protein
MGDQDSGQSHNAYRQRDQGDYVAPAEAGLMFVIDRGNRCPDKPVSGSLGLKSRSLHAG